MPKSNATLGAFHHSAKSRLHFAPAFHVFSQIAMCEYEDNNNNGGLQSCVCAADSAEFINPPQAKYRYVEPLNEENQSKYN